ncbi:receptor-type tyrosine-protein phosphatase-like N, partial [Leucoraja erinacea]|uniref:receptor-type tyrosine-protein phosphatase-like N n=1 Tax=Leucoraja erinaceus TaxID=7782 RepID=UPI00245736C5
CLFDEGLCSVQERCVTDGLFGHCQDALIPIRSQYDVSPIVLDRLQEVLRQLLLQGLSWQDDVTQYVIGMEMEKVPRFLPAQRRLSTARAGERLAMPPEAARRPVDIPPDQWPVSEIRRYLKLLLPLDRGAGRDYPVPYPNPQGVSVLELRGMGERSVQRKNGLHSVNDPDYPTDHGNRHRPVDADWTLNHRDGPKATDAELHTPRPQAAPEATGGLRPKKKGSVLEGSNQRQPESGSRTAEDVSPGPESAVGSDGRKEERGREPGVGAVDRGEAVLRKRGEVLHPDPSPTTTTTGSGKEEYAYIVTSKSVIGPALTFRLRHNDHNVTVDDVATKADADKSGLEAETGLKIVQAGVGERNAFHRQPKPAGHGGAFRFLLLTFIAVAGMAGILVAGAVIYCLRQSAKRRHKEKLAGIGAEGTAETSLEYQELCRQHMATKSYARTDTVDTSRVTSVSSQFSDAPQASPSSHSSTPSWCEEPVQSNMDISTGHMILTYMEDHLKIKDRLHKEWEALCAYQAEPNACTVAQTEANAKKCRNPAFVPYDHNRVVLKAEMNPSRTDFINASPIVSVDNGLGA